ncbi:leucine--tRNA ligase [Candidatus Sumerlaeota bacterium]|nr:leucine--tRNA ligase [Candidatus Sumerlaeota bacterium]
MSEHIYDPVVVEKKWQKWWDDHGTNEIDLRAAKNPYYVLMMFPYPSAEGLHVGNVYAFTGADVTGRHRRLRGHDVFEPIGFDAFGIHSENFAMKINRHPAELIPANIANFTRQLRMMGLMYDWRRSVDTTSPDYYKWTQWIFLQLYKAGLAYRDEKEVNFCPDCGTVIADEQVIDGKCERHPGTDVQRRRLPSWFFRITNFAERLDGNLDWIDWSEKTKLAQKNWIGRSEGAEVDFQVKGRGEKIRVYTTRPDTLFGATFMVLAVDHPLVDAIAGAREKEAIAKYREQAAARATDAAHDTGVRSPQASVPQSTESIVREKTGVFIGANAINPVNNAEIPIYISDYVLSGYGTGAIMAVPAHDERDFEFAEKFHLPIKCVISPDAAALAEFRLPDPISRDSHDSEAIREEILKGQTCWSGAGVAMNSANAEVSLNGLAVDEAKARITKWLESKNLGKARTTFRLRDWGISRQRYWGPPIPVLYDEDGNIHPVPEDQLPVTLPPIRDFRPKGDGRGPLANVPEWMNVEINGKKYRRETDVMDNFLDSAWYYLRYVSTDEDSRPYDPELIRKWLPLDVYIGGNEHAVLHLLYTRFICMALDHAGALKMGTRPGMRDAAEPFQKFRAHGLLIKEGSKMSKSKGNVVNPDEYVEKWGADTLRLYLMFLGPYQQGGDFRDTDIVGMRRFLNRLHTWYYDSAQPIVADETLPKPLRVKTHQTIKKVREDIDALSYNTAISAIMELFNMAKDAAQTSAFVREAIIIALAPLAPHFAEEIWQGALRKPESIWKSGRYPDYIEELTKLDEMEIVLQVNGKIRDKIIVPRDADKEQLEAIALSSEKVQAALAGATPKKIIVVPGRLINVLAS